MASKTILVPPRPSVVLMFPVKALAVVAVSALPVTSPVTSPVNIAAAGSPTLASKTILVPPRPSVVLMFPVKSPVTSPVTSKVPPTVTSPPRATVPVAVKSITVIPAAPNVPVVNTFWEPKSGAIFVPAIAAFVFISASTISSSNILAEVTASSDISPACMASVPKSTAPEAVRPVTVVAPAPNVPVVTTFWAPKSGAILVPAIAAFVFTSASTISSSNILAEVTASSDISPACMASVPKSTAPEAVRPVTVVAPAPNVPVVTTFWAPKSGSIFDPAIAAFVFTSALTISSSNILAEVTCESCISLVCIASVPRVTVPVAVKSVTVVAAAPNAPVVSTFWAPKSGSIFDPAIAAFVFTSALTISSSNILAEVTCESCISLVCIASVPRVTVPVAVKSVTVVAAAPNVPVVSTFWVPKSGSIFVPAIAAFVFTSALTISSSNILAEVTAPAAISAVAIVPSSISVVVTAPAAIVTLVFCVFTANNAKGTAVKGALLISIKFEQLSYALNSIFKFLANKLHLMSSKDKA